MNKKDRTIRALLKTAEKYENPKGHTFFSPQYCELCKIHKKDNNCRGCISANREGNPGCWEFKSLNEAYNSVDSIGFYFIIEKSTSEFFKRAKILRNYAYIYSQVTNLAR